LVILDRIQVEANSEKAIASDTIEELLDRVSNTHEELVAIERNLERLRADIAKAEKQRDVPGKRR
jgi:peptidoglycan hydrolase CwlO-like protein